MQNLHSHTCFSNLFASFKDSHVFYSDYCKRTHALGHQVVTSVEHGFQGNFLKCYSTVEAYNAANSDANLKFVMGTEAYWVPNRKESDKMNAHMLILARNLDGIYEINEMLTEANETGYYYKPRIDPELMLQLTPKNVLVTTACVSGWGNIDKETNQLEWYGDNFESPEWMERHVNMLHDHFGSSLYLEVQAHNTDWQRIINKECLKLHYKEDIPIILGLDSHYIYPEQAEERRYLREESGIKMTDADHELNSDVFEDYPDDETIIKRMTKQGVLSLSEINEAMDNTDVSLTFEDIVFDRTRKLPTIYPDLSQEERNDLYKNKVWSAWGEYKKNIPQEKWNEYEAGINGEIETVTSTGVADYFLFDEAMVKRGIENGGRVTPTGRGSAGGFFTNTLLGFSTLDRFSLPVKLYPERFVTAERLKSSLPDLDLNIDDQIPFAKAQEELLGSGHSYPMISYGTLKTKAAFKLYARARSLDPQIQNEVSKQIDAYEKAVSFADDDDKDSVVLDDYVDARYVEYINESEPYRGIVVSKSQAPCSFLLYNGDIRREIGIMRVKSENSKKESYCTVVDGYTAEEFGYVKNDILIVSVISVNTLTMQLAGLPSYTSKEIIELTKNDNKTWNIFAKGLTMGINQCERENTRERIMQYKPRTLEDLSAFVGAIRPGFKSQLKDFIARNHFRYGIKSFDEILKNDSSGSSWLLYQENIMTCLSMAGFSMEETYPIIKAISKKKKEKIASAKERFLVGFAKHIVDVEHISIEDAQKASEIAWKVIEDSASYSFNAAHAVAVALDALYGAYLKANYPYEYYTALLTKAAQKGNKERISDIREEMRRGFDITMGHCKFGDDNTQFVINKNNHSIEDVLMSAKGFSATTAKALRRMGNGFYSGFIDFLVCALDEPAVTTARIEALIKMGYFDCFGSKAKLLALLDAFNNGPLNISKTHKQETNMKRLTKLYELEDTLECPEIDQRDLLKFEISIYGTPLSTFNNIKGDMGVISVETKYTPVVMLYNARTGKTGKVKIKKKSFNENPLLVGDIIKITSWKEKPKYNYGGDKPVAIPGTKELWVDGYMKVC